VCVWVWGVCVCVCGVCVCVVCVCDVCVSVVCVCVCVCVWSVCVCVCVCLCVCAKLEEPWMLVWTIKWTQTKSLGKRNFKTCSVIYIRILWSKLAMSKTRMFYLFNAIRDLISETLNTKVRNSTNNYFPRTHTKYYLVILCIVYNTKYNSYQNINRCSISHKIDYRAVWLGCLSSQD